MNNKDKLLKEQRTIEATKKKMMGPGGKLGTIVKWLGTPIIRQGGCYYDQTPMEDVWQLPEEADELLTMEDEEVIAEGWVFDGLSRGIHIDIKYLDFEKTLTCDYKGYRVYTEIAGDLFSYAPFVEWENDIDRLYRAAIKKREKVVQIEEEAAKEEAIEENKNFLQRLRFRWGI